MAESQRKTDRIGTISGTNMIGLGLVGLGAFGIGYFWWKDRTENEMIREYMDEAALLFDYIVATSQKPGGATDQDMAVIGQMETLMKGKEERIAEYSEGWFETIIDKTIELLKESYGVAIVIGAVAVGSLVAFAIYKLMKKFPPRPRPPTCPDDGLQFSTPDELARHIETEHAPNPNPPDVASAQAMVFAEPTWVNDAIAAASGLGARYYYGWDGLQSYEIIAIASALAIATCIIVPALTPALALLIL